MDELLINISNGEVKALGGGKVGGWAIVHTDASQPDLSDHRDWFTKETDYDFEEDRARVSVYYAHGGDPEVKARRFRRADLETKEAGVWFEHQLELADEYEQKIYALAERKKLGLSTGSVPHLVERERHGDTHKIVRWPIAEVSYTVEPACPLTRGVQPLKSFLKSLFGDGVSRERDAAPPPIDFAGWLKTATDEQVSDLFSELGYTGGLDVLIRQAGAWQGHASPFNVSCTKEGRVLSQSKRSQLSQWLEKVTALRDELSALLTATEPQPKPEAVPSAEAPDTEAAPGHAISRELLRTRAQALLTFAQGA